MDEVIVGRAERFEARPTGTSKFWVEDNEIHVWPTVFGPNNSRIANPAFSAARDGKYGFWHISWKEESYKGNNYTRAYCGNFTEDGVTPVEPDRQAKTGPTSSTMHTSSRSAQTYSESNKYPSFALSYAKDLMVSVLHREAIPVGEGWEQSVIDSTLSMATQLLQWLKEEGTD